MWLIDSAGFQRDATAGRRPTTDRVMNPGFQIGLRGRFGSLLAGELPPQPSVSGHASDVRFSIFSNLDNYVY